MAAYEKTIQTADNPAGAPSAEHTKTGPTFVPEVDIFETEKELTLIADMPGVKPENLDIDLRENTLTLYGNVDRPEGEGEVDVYREYYTGKYYRQFSLSEVIDQEKIDAKLNNGVLRLTLPKIEKATPRKIEVKAG